MGQKVSVHEALHGFEFSPTGRQRVSVHESLHDLRTLTKYEEPRTPFVEVAPEQFEAALQKHPNIASIDSDRDYNGKRTFLSPDGKAGYALHHSGELNHVFSMQPGLGAHAVQDSLTRGASHLSCFDGKLPEYYKRFGFQEQRREKNWTPGGPDVVYMTHPGVAKSEGPVSLEEIRQHLLHGLRDVLKKHGQ